MKRKLYSQFCEEMDNLCYRLMRAKEFTPWKIPYWEQMIKEHKLMCKHCS